MMLRIFIALLSLFPFLRELEGGRDGAREARIAYLKQHAVPVRSIDTDDSDFTDLEPLRASIGERRIVMLGESTHGDGATFTAKIRLIKFLHQQMGFDVLAFEGGFYDIRKTWSVLRSAEAPAKSLSSAVDKIWGASRQAQSLWGYLAGQLKTTRPLELAGFDPQFTGNASRDLLLTDLRNYILSAGLPPAAVAAGFQFAETLALVLEDPNFMANGSQFKKARPDEQTATLSSGTVFGEALGLLRPAGDSARLERDFWIQFVKSSSELLRQYWRVNAESLDRMTIDWAINLRDRQMGDNFIWLAKRAYPARKIVIWAATSHIVRHSGLSPDLQDPMIGMGDWIDKAMGPDVYALGFTSYKGRWGTVEMAEPTELPAAAPNSLEDLFYSAGFEYAFMDFRNAPADGSWLRAPLSCRALRSVPVTTDWTRVMDGIFFIKEMFPSLRTED
jgi:erythromycin esterase